MAHQRKRRPQDDKAPQAQAQVQSSLFSSPDYEQTEEDMGGDRPSSSSLTLDDQRQLAAKPSFDFSQIPITAPGQEPMSPIQRRPRVPLLQAKLTVGAANDKYEQEADQVAAEVVKTINSPGREAPVQREGLEDPTGAIQRVPDDEKEGQPVTLMGEAGNEDLFADQKEGQPETLMGEAGNENLFPDQPEGKGETLMGEVGNEELFADQNEGQLETLMGMETPEDKEDLDEEEKIMRKPTLRAQGESGGPLAANVESEIQSAKGGGQALDPDLQVRMGKAMGADFSGVRVHTGAQSDRLNESIQAKAFTMGQDVFFKQGAYQPGRRGGQELIAHELTHVIQQGSRQDQTSSRSTGSEIIQKKMTSDGLPEKLKDGVENLSGYRLDDVKVTYNSEQPAKFGAEAYTKGTEIHLGPHHEDHLPHEAWHVVQQKQGRVKKTSEENNQAVNTNPQLEREADAKGNAAANSQHVHQFNRGVEAVKSLEPQGSSPTEVIQFRTVRAISGEVNTLFTRIKQCFPQTPDCAQIQAARATVDAVETRYDAIVTELASDHNDVWQMRRGRRKEIDNRKKQMNRDWAENGPPTDQAVLNAQNQEYRALSAERPKAHLAESTYALHDIIATSRRHLNTVADSAYYWDVIYDRCPTKLRYESEGKKYGYYSDLLTAYWACPAQYLGVARPQGLGDRLYLHIHYQQGSKKIGKAHIKINNKKELGGYWQHLYDSGFDAAKRVKAQDTGKGQAETNVMINAATLFTVNVYDT